MGVKAINVIRLVTRLLELGVNSDIIRQSLIYAGMPEKYVELCMEHVWRSEAERLSKLVEEAYSQIKAHLTKLNEIISSQSP